MLVALGAAGGFAYVYKLKADNAILKANQEKLETAVQEQQELLEVKELEYQYIIEKSKELEEKLDAARADNEELTKKFAKYDIETWGMQDPDRTAETINNAVADVNRCIEISTGGEITEEDKDNKQCPEMIMIISGHCLLSLSSSVISPPVDISIHLFTSATALLIVSAVLSGSCIPQVSISYLANFFVSSSLSARAASSFSSSSFDFSIMY